MYSQSYMETTYESPNAKVIADKILIVIRCEQSASNFYETAASLCDVFLTLSKYGSARCEIR